jgi:hypothetical protein
MGEPEDAKHWHERVLAAHERRRRRIRRGAKIAAIAGAAVFALTVLPGWMLEHGKKAAIDCFNEQYETGRGDPLACASTERLWLAYPSIVPWKRSEALHAIADDRLDAAWYALEDATSLDPDEKKRASAAAAMIAAAREAYGAPGFDAAALRISTAARLSTSGTFDELARHGAECQKWDECEYALDAAVVTARVDDVPALARWDAGGDLHAYDWELKRGAWLCLLGERDAGLAAFRAADTGWQTVVSSLPGWLNARMALVACGGPDEAKQYRDVHDYERSAMGALLADEEPGFELRQMMFSDDLQAPRDGERLPFAALALAQGGPPDLTTALQDVDGGYLSKRTIVSVRTTIPMPWVPELGGGLLGGQPIAESPEAMEKAGDRLEALAVSSPETLPPPSKDDWEERRTWPHHALAAKVPRVALNNAAWAMWMEAANERVRRGQHEQAREDAERAVKLTRLDETDVRELEASVLVASGDAGRALELTTALESGPLTGARPSATTAYVALVQSFAAAALGRFDDAYAAAERARDRAVKASGSTGTLAQMAEDATVNASEWMLVAMALRTGRPDPADLHPKYAMETEDVAAKWLARVRLKEDARRIDRRHSSSGAFPPSLVLPAAYYVAGRATDGDVEVWLDRTFYGDMTRQVRCKMLARAEAARWRGDAAAARKWEDRVKRLNALVHDGRTALLATVAGL